MLLEALRLINSGQASTPAELADRLGLSPALGAQILADLVRLDYLRPYGVECPGQCAGCPGAKICHATLRLWAVTAKGRRALGLPDAEKGRG